MWHRIRLEMTVAAALAIAIAALVVALRNGDSGSATVAVVDEPADVAEESVAADLVPEGAVEVQISAFTFIPEPVRVQAGEPVMWTNRDGGVPHTVTATDGSWDSEIMELGDTFSMTFDEPGVYVYICTLHPPRQGISFAPPEGEELAGGGGKGMQGTVIVE